MAMLQDPMNPLNNQLLCALPAAIYEQLLPHLKLVPLPRGKALYEATERLEYAYFPISAIVSLSNILENGASAEIAVVGNEGVVGIALFLSDLTTPTRAEVQSAGYGYRLTGHRLKEECARSTPLQQLLLRYTAALLTQMGQTAACNRHHSIDQQLCRRLLVSLDRSSSNELGMTQQLIAEGLGVRREGVTAAAGKLQHAGLIRYRRGHITVLDRRGLEARACECYQVVKNECSRLLPAAPAH